MSTREAMEAAVRAAGIGAPAHYEEVVESTNAVAMALAAEEAPEWTVVAAGQQRAGRGRLGREWVSEPGQSLLCSLILRPKFVPDKAGLLTLLAGAAMAEAARLACNAQVRCKWPNDLMLGEGKAGGILAESHVAGGYLQFVIVGLGVNVLSAPAGVPGAVALGGGDLAGLLQSFLWVLRRLYHPEHGEFPDEVRAAYRPVSATIGLRVRAVTTDGREVEGLATDVDPRGNLLIDTGEGALAAVGFGEIAHLER